MWPMKDNGQGKALEAVEAGQKIAVFQIHVNYFLF